MKDNTMTFARIFTMATLVTAAVSRCEEKPLPANQSLLTSPYVSLIKPRAEEKASINIVTVKGMTFAEAIRITNLKDMGKFYDFQTIVPCPAALTRGDLLLVRFYARGNCPTNESGEADCQVYFQKNGPDYHKPLTTRLLAGPEWRHYDYGFSMPKSYAAQETALCFGTGFKKQWIEIGGVELLRFEKGTKISELPHTAIRYPGMAADAPWRGEARQRIEQFRKGDMSIQVVSADGKPVPGADVSVKMIKHAFHFSSVIKARLINEQSETAEIYRAKVLELFNASGTENALKWPPWVGQWGGNSQEDTLRALRWLKGHGLHLRGHVMVWPSWKHLPKDVSALKGTPEEKKIPDIVRNHITDIGTATRDILDEWDVINETRSNHDLMDLFGREIMVDWFAAAKEALPTQELYINDYSILSGGGRGSEVHETYKETINYLIDKGAPITGIGLQSHFGGHLNDPAKVYGILEDFAQLGLKMRITEFDIDITDEQAQAAYTRDFMTVIFSHPAVVGFQMWGFWEGAHWKPKGAMYRQDWEEKPNLKAYKDLLFREWWTDEQLRTRADGQCQVRGFAGDYAVTAERDGKSASARVPLASDGGTVTLMLGTHRP